MLCHVVSCFLGHVLNITEKSLLSKGLNFADYMLPFELLYKEVDSLDISNLDKEFIKSSIRDSAFSSYKDTSKAFEKNFPKAEFDAFENEKCKIKNILNDSSKFHKVCIEHDKILNHLIHMKNRVTDVIKNLRDKNEISIEQYKDLSHSGSRPGIMYGLAKVHKMVKDGLQSILICLDLFCLPLVHQNTNFQT